MCLKRHHLSRDCRSPARCSRCNGRHYTSICKGSHVPPSNRSSGNSNHQPSRSQNNTPTGQGLPANAQQSSHSQTPQLSQTSTAAGPPNSTTTTGLYCVNADTPVLLQTAQTYIHKPSNPSCGMTIRLMLDGGSQRSYITQRVKDVLGLESERAEEMHIQTFGSENTRAQTVEMVKATISLKERGSTQVLFAAVPLICEPLSCQPIAYIKQKYNHLAGLDLADSSQVGDELQLDALIGSDHYWQLATGKIILGQSGPTAIHTHLRWVLSGPVWSAAQQNTLNSQISHTLHIQSTSSAPHLDNLLTQFGELESLEITQNEPSVHEAFKKSIQFKNGRYKVSLPWCRNQSQLPTNFELARKRLQGLLKRLRQHPEVQQEYHVVIQEQLRLGIVEKCSDQLRQSSNDTIHYLPHHTIICTDKQTTKLRIVYDASARDNGPSLNDCLFSGPKFDQSMLDILLRFCTYKIALIADIEKAFLMVSVQEEDRNVLRFLWVDDVQKSPPIIEEMKFTRVVFGVSASPFLLNATINHHLERYRDKYPNLVDTLLHSMYVDDVTCGANSEDEAYQIYDISINLFAEGGFNLRKFVTNSSSLQQRISVSNQNPSCP